MRKTLLLATFAAVATALVAQGAMAQVAEDSVAGRATTDFFFQTIEIDARSGPTGENPTGTAFFTDPAGERLGGPVTCLAIDGNTALIVVEEPDFLGVGFLAMHVVDNSATGLPDTFLALPTAAPDDCSPLNGLLPIASGDLAVIDAPGLPTSKDECKNGGWRTYGVFKNQGDCVSFVATGGKNPPGKKTP